MFKKILISAVFAAAVSTPAYAQVNANNLVNVNISNVTVIAELEEIISDNNVVIPAQIQVPIGVAANVCPDVTAAVLAQQIKDTGSATCNAEQASQALARQIVRNNKKS